MSQGTTSQQDKVGALEAKVRHLTFLHEDLQTKLRHAKEIEALEREKLRLEMMNEILLRMPQL